MTTDTKTKPVRMRWVPVKVWTPMMQCSVCKQPYGDPYSHPTHGRRDRTGDRPIELELERYELVEVKEGEQHYVYECKQGRVLGNKDLCG